MISRKRKLAATVVASIILKRKRVLNNNKTCLVKQWIDRRCTFGAGSALIRELKIEDSQQFRNFCRLTSCEVEYIIESIGPTIYKKNTVLRKAIPVHDRVMVMG